MTRVIHYICNIKIKDFLLCQYVIYGPRKKSIIYMCIIIYLFKRQLLSFSENELFIKWWY